MQHVVDAEPSDHFESGRERVAEHSQLRLKTMRDRVRSDASAIQERRAWCTDQLSGDAYKSRLTIGAHVQSRETLPVDALLEVVRSRVVIALVRELLDPSTAP